MKKQIGFPLVLLTYSFYPFFKTFFEELGYEVVFSDPSDDVQAAVCIDMDENVCWAVKLLRTHVVNLIQKGLRTIFIPTAYSVKLKNVTEKAKYECMYIQCLQYFLKNDVVLKSFDIELLAPQLNIDYNNPYYDKNLFKLAVNKLGFSESQVKLAMYKAGSNLVYENNIRSKAGYLTVKNLSAGEKIIVILNRDYITRDPLLNLGLQERFKKRGYKTLTLEDLYMLMEKSPDDYDGVYWAFGQFFLRGVRTVHNNPAMYGVMIVDEQCGPNNILVQLFSDIMGKKPNLVLDIRDYNDIKKIDKKIDNFIELLEGTKKSVFFKIHRRGNMYDNLTHLKRDREVIFPSFPPYSRIFAETIASIGYDVSKIPLTSIETLEAGLINTHVFASASLHAMAGDVLRWISKNPKDQSKKKQIITFRTEGAENEGLFALIMRTLLDSFKRDDVDIFAPYVESLIEDEKYSLTFDLLWQSVLQGDEELKVLYGETSSQNRPKVFITGEPYVICNNVITNNFLSIIAEKYADVVISPLSEYVLFLWHDKIRNTKDVSSYTERLYDKCNKDISKISENFDELIDIADSKLPHVKGGNIRYRYAKFIQGNPDCCMQINMSSKNENAANILNQFEHTIKTRTPFINLSFDGGDIDNQLEQFRTMFESLK